MNLTSPNLPVLAVDDQLRPSDVTAIGAMVRASGVFTEVEIAVAMELASAKLDGSDDSYCFVFMRDENGSPVGYSCYGEIPLTDLRFDLYWIVVDPAWQGLGIARRLLQETEARIRARAGVQLHAETSGTEAYLPAQQFYLKQGFEEVARLRDFYRTDDDKVMFCKRL